MDKTCFYCGAVLFKRKGRPRKYCDDCTGRGLPRRDAQSKYNQTNDERVKSEIMRLQHVDEKDVEGALVLRNAKREALEIKRAALKAKYESHLEKQGRS